MHRLLSRTSLLLSAILSLATVAHAQQAAPATGVKTPMLLRADQPNRGPGDDGVTGDPSMASEYNAVRAGINLNGVGILFTPDPMSPGFGFVCTTSRIGKRTMLAAAHCVTDENTGAVLTQNSDIYMFGPGSTNGSPSFWGGTSSSVVVRPEWQGFNATYNTGYDVAVINFDYDLPSWMTTYQLYYQDPMFMSAVEVGVGTYGNGDQGGVGFDFNRRQGENRVDLYDNSTLAYSDWNILWADFDDGTIQHDAWCYFGLCDTGKGLFESSLDPGDSGGPIFVNGKIAGVASFGTYFCSAGPGCSPASPPLKNASVTDGYGSLTGHAGVWGNQAFLDEQLALHSTPEPVTLVLVGTGMFFTGVARRRRRQ